MHALIHLAVLLGAVGIANAGLSKLFYRLICVQCAKLGYAAMTAMYVDVSLWVSSGIIAFSLDHCVSVNSIIELVAANNEISRPLFPHPQA